MHETGIVRDLVRKLEQAAREAGAERVSGVEVWLGALSQFSSAHFREHFDEEVQGTVAEGAILRIGVSEDVSHPQAQNVMIHSVELEVPDEPLERQRLRLDITGAVQGVGFRPFVHRLAVAEGLGGFVCNTGDGVSVEVEGDEPAIERFLARLDAEIVPPACVHEKRVRRLAVQGEQRFMIVPSTGAGRAALVLPDLATCAACLDEILDPADRRYRYPFTSCQHCGPRYSVIETVPYDRVRTTIRQFVMCAACEAEYRDPRSRRFHAQTNACPDCGPQIALWDAAGHTLAMRDEALMAAAEALRAGRIVALKGLGGFQLLVDARSEAAVQRLRARKRRPAKPFAIMAPSLAAARMLAEISDEDRRLLGSVAAPIVLLRARPGQVAAKVAPANPLLGLMLPYTPLHHLLLRELDFAVVATSGNRSDETLVTGEREALERLAGLADLFLVHDRPILRPVDDSVVRVIAGRETVLRSARGYAPLSLAHPAATKPLLALGGQLKNSLALAANGRIVLGPHIGDLGNPETRAAHAQAIDGMTQLYGLSAEVVVCDAHPDYHSTQVADRLGLPVKRAPHHLAHLLAGMLDNGLEGPVLGVAWDGSGYGGDGTVWGGEFLTVDGKAWRRLAHLLPFRLPGGEAAVREPRRAALGVLYAMFGAEALAMANFTPAERPVLATMLARGVNAPWTTSAGRLFDAVAAILGLRQTASFEGEAAMALEFAAEQASSTRTLPCGNPLVGDPLVIDWRPMLAAILDARRAGARVEDLAAAFHEALAETIVAVAMRVGIEQVLLSGGCFQNTLLTEHTVLRLRAAGFEPYWHHRVPPNDGGLAAGQAVFAARENC